MCGAELVDHYGGKDISREGGGDPEGGEEEGYEGFHAEGGVEDAVVGYHEDSCW